MTKLSDTQLVLLSMAANRAGGSLFPPAASVTARADHIRRSVEALIRKQLAHEFETEDADCACASRWGHLLRCHNDGCRAHSIGDAPVRRSFTA
jgi:hypothetical protein